MMTKRLLLTNALALLITASFAQFTMGIKGGLNLASFNTSYVNGENNTDYKNLISYHGGAFVSVQFKKIAIQPEFIYSVQGTKMDYLDPNNSDPKQWESNFTYFSIPVVLKYYLVKSRAVDVNIQAGPQFAFLQKAEANYIEFDGDGAQSRSGFEDVKAEYESADFGVVFGAGVDLPLRLTVDIRYYMGLQNIARAESSPETKNQLIQVSLGFKLLKVSR